MMAKLTISYSPKKAKKKPKQVGIPSFKLKSLEFSTTLKAGVKNISSPKLFTFPFFIFKVKGALQYDEYGPK